MSLVSGAEPNTGGDAGTQGDGQEQGTRKEGAHLLPEH